MLEMAAQNCWPSDIVPKCASQAGRRLKVRPGAVALARNTMRQTSRVCSLVQKGHPNIKYIAAPKPEGGLAPIVKSPEAEKVAVKFRGGAPVPCVGAVSSRLVEPFRRSRLNLTKRRKPFVGDDTPRWLVVSVSAARVPHAVRWRSVIERQAFRVNCIRARATARAGDDFNLVVGRGRTTVDRPPVTKTMLPTVPDIGPMRDPVSAIAMASDFGFRGRRVGGTPLAVGVLSA